MRRPGAGGGRGGRARRRDGRPVEAARRPLPAGCDVAVLGGGASGLVAAIVAAEAGARVVVLERDAECGRTILATGNGRCNFANARLDPARLNDPAFVAAVCGEGWLDDVLALFRDSGLRWCEEGGRLYPLSRQAASVRSVLVSRARRAGVALAPAREVVGVTPTAGGWSVAHAAPGADALAPAARDALRARGVVVATGGAALTALDGLGLDLRPREPLLCPVACEGPPLSSVDGRRVRAVVSLARDASRAPLWRDRGEVLFRPWGLSGVVIFDLSRRVRAGDVVELDLVPDVTAGELRGIVHGRRGGDLADAALDGVLDPRVAALVCRLARERWRLPGREGRDPGSDAEAAVALAKALPLRVRGLAETSRAQVVRGGLACARFDPRTLAADGLPGLFACGEALDVDGDCGGFNLAWAWKSGMVAGAAAARMGGGG